MKYRKPVVVDMLPHDIADFLRSLPDEFEILGLGEVAVKWPEGLTKSHLEGVSLGISWPPARTAIDALAAIAPKMKKRRVALWRHETDRAGYEPMVLNVESVPGSSWRKVGECEIEE